MPPTKNKHESQRLRRWRKITHKNYLPRIKRRKKFLAQRGRGETLQQMTSDYNDFVHQNRRRVRNVSSIQSSDSFGRNLDIASVSEQYYSPENYHENYRARASTGIEAKDINSVLFEADFFYASSQGPRWQHILEWQKREQHLRARLEEIERMHAYYYYADPHYVQERADLLKQSKAHARGVEWFESAKGFVYANTTIRVRGNHVRVRPRVETRRAGADPMKMANAVWRAYQSDLHIRTLVTMTDANTETEWKKSAGPPVELSGLLDTTIPELWAMHAIIFEFMGYDRLFKETFSLRMSLVKEKKKSARLNYDADHRIWRPPNYVEYPFIATTGH